MNAARQGQVVRVSDKRYFMPEVVRELVQFVEALVAADPAGQFSVKAYRDKAAIGRNAAIEILEYFDRVGYTRRLDQVRQIRKPATEAFGSLFD
jgi:selenocysteine-specific elongation factor